MNIFDLIPDSEIKRLVGPFFDKERYYSAGKHETKRYIDLSGIKPNFHVLDIGCGCGKMAIHFSEYLSKQGLYTGIDSNKLLLDYCVEKIQPYFDNFAFHYMDVFNGYFSPNGKVVVKDVRFPLEDSSVDVVIANSLFTHMYLEDVGFYLKEIFRVLKPKGKVAATYFLLNKISEKAIEMKLSSFNFNFPVGKYSKTYYPQIPELGLSHNEEDINAQYMQNGMKILNTQYGGWICKNEENLQDLIIAEK